MIVACWKYSAYPWLCMLSSCVYNTVCSEFRGLKIEKCRRNQIFQLAWIFHPRWNPKSLRFPVNKRSFRKKLLRNCCCLNKAACCDPVASQQLCLQHSSLTEALMHLHWSLSSLELLWLCSLCRPVQAWAFLSHCLESTSWYFQLLSLWGS